MNPYSVLLLRPDSIADEFGKDTYLAHVVANGAADAVRAARAEASASDHQEDDDDDGPIPPKDYHVLFCCLGHQEDLSVG